MEYDMNQEGVTIRYNFKLNDDDRAACWWLSAMYPNNRFFKLLSDYRGV